MCNTGDDKELMTDAQLAVALADATTKGLIKWRSDEDIDLTDKGIDCAFELRESMGDMNYVIMQMFFERIREMAEQEKQE